MMPFKHSPVLCTQLNLVYTTIFTMLKIYVATVQTLFHGSSLHLTFLTNPLQRKRTQY